MKEIGEEFKLKREEIGISIQEVSNDLKKDVILIENLESGNHKVFKDVLELKDMVSSYAIYYWYRKEKFLWIYSCDCTYCSYFNYFLYSFEEFIFVGGVYEV